ncbi:MAG TPA: hypothetical protein VKR52_03080 [Terracidiphilus sp.]|nr:hypothetical protein [Terracidiphilus sp.]
MNAVTQVAPAPVESTVQRWSLVSRIGFRFCVVYLGLFCFSNQIVQGIFPIPKIDQPEFDSLRPISSLVIWTGAYILRLKTPLVYAETGSGDRSWDWVVLFLAFVIALIATIAWSILDRRREAYPTLSKWFLLFIRFCLAGQLITYGAVKLIPLQMPFPFLFTQMEPFASMSPMGVLWTSIGASPAYEIFAGCAELTGGLLLIFPRTATLGALVGLADMIQVFMLNMTYDVPVKILSFHLILLSLVLLAPEARGLANFFFFHRTAEPANRVTLFRTSRANRIALVVQVFLWIWILGNTVYSDWTSWRQYGAGAPQSALYGVWDITQYTRDGQVRPPLLTDNDRWRRLIFDRPDFVSFQKMDASNGFCDASIDTKNSSITLTKGDDKNWKGAFTYTRPSPDQLVFDGSMDGHQVQLQLKRIDHTKFLFVSRGFHWISERPFNR